MMTLGNDRIRKKLDDIDGKIGLMIEYCRSLELENKALLLKIKNLEADHDEDKYAESIFLKADSLIQSKTERFLEKLKTFSSSADKTESSGL